MGEGLALSLYIIYNICGLHSESGCSPHCLSLHGSNVFPEECSNDKGAMMSFLPKRPDVFPWECSNAKGAMMSFAPKRPDVFPWERSCICWMVMLLVSSQVLVGFGSRFLVAWEAASRGWKRCCGGLAKRVSGCLENCFGGRGNEA